jgi:hypothetical protein
MGVLVGAGVLVAGATVAVGGAGVFVAGTAVFVAGGAAVLVAGAVVGAGLLVGVATGTERSSPQAASQPLNSKAHTKSITRRKLLLDIADDSFR